MGKTTIQKLTLIFSGIAFLVNICTFSFQGLIIDNSDSQEQYDQFQDKSGLHSEITTPEILIDLEEKEIESNEKVQEEEMNGSSDLSFFIASGAQIFEFSSKALYFKNDRTPFHATNLYIKYENLRL